MAANDADTPLKMGPQMSLKRQKQFRRAPPPKLRKGRGAFVVLVVMIVTGVCGTAIGFWLQDSYNDISEQILGLTPEEKAAAPTNNAAPAADSKPKINFN